MNTEMGNPRIRWQETVLELLNIEILQHPILELEKELVKEVGEEVRNLQNKNPHSQNDNI